jgi:hypothetical protein
VENYFNYFTEVEEQFQRRRGTILLLSTLDWALIETWKDAGIPLAAVLRGIDAAFDHYDRKPAKSRKVNSLAYCSQEVLSAAEEMKEAAVGAVSEEEIATKPDAFQNSEIVTFLRKNAAQLESAKLPQRQGISAGAMAAEAVQSLRDLASSIESAATLPRLEDLERRLTAMEEKLFAALLATTPDDEIIEVRAAADRELAPYRSKMIAAQIDQLQKQYLQKKLLEKHRLPRLSLFYM